MYARRGGKGRRVRSSIIKVEANLVAMDDAGDGGICTKMGSDSHGVRCENSAKHKNVENRTNKKSC